MLVESYSAWEEMGFRLVYRDEEYSFDVEPSQQGEGRSVLINDLHLELADDDTVLYVWGVCPLMACQEVTEFPRNYRRRFLRILAGVSLSPGISYRVNAGEAWPVHCNRALGWICIGSSILEERTQIEFAPGCIAILDGGGLVALWLHPSNSLRLS